MQNILFIGAGAAGASVASLLGYCIALARVRAKLARERDRHRDLLADLGTQLDRVAKQRDDQRARIGELEGACRADVVELRQAQDSFANARVGPIVTRLVRPRSTRP